MNKHYYNKYYYEKNKERILLKNRLYSKYYYYCKKHNIPLKSNKQKLCGDYILTMKKGIPLKLISNVKRFNVSAEPYYTSRFENGIYTLTPNI